jgi:lipoprotein-releasing system permease protein
MSRNRMVVANLRINYHRLNLPFFISKRINAEGQGSFSSTISRIAIASVAIGLAAVLVSFMILEGFQRTIKDKIFSFAGHLQVTKYTLASSIEDDPISTGSDFYQNYQEIDFIEHVQSYAYKAGLLKTPNEVQGIVIKGVGRDFDLERFESNMIEGRFIQHPDSGYSQEVVISSAMSSLLQLGVGDKSLVYFVQNPPRYRPVEVVGIYKTDLEDFDQKFLIGDLGLVQRINNWPDTLVGGFEVFVSSGTDHSMAEDVLFDFIDYDLYVDKVSDKYLQIFDWLSLLDRNLVVFLWLILFVAAFNMVSILLILIMERTQMIGMLKALGAPHGLIQKVFVYNGTLLIVKGMVIGNLAALAIGLLQDYFKIIPLDPVNYYMAYVPIEWNMGIFVALNIATFVVVNLTLILPTFVISRLNTINAIRFS